MPDLRSEIDRFMRVTARQPSADELLTEQFEQVLAVAHLRAADVLWCDGEGRLYFGRRERMPAIHLRVEVPLDWGEAERGREDHYAGDRGKED